MSSSSITRPSLKRKSSNNTSGMPSISTTSSSSSMTGAANPTPASPPRSLASGGLPPADATTSATALLPSAPKSLLSGALPQSLLQGNSAAAAAESYGSVPARPRRLWTIADTSLKSIPKHYPPLDPNCTVYIGDASPSVVAVRISECFRKQSVAVEYDDESITASAMTVDRCHFTVQLWKGNVTAGVDFSHGVVVECMRVSGNSLTFHTICRAIQKAALGQSDGAPAMKRRRPNLIRGGLDFASLDAPSGKTWSKSASSRSMNLADHALEQVQEWLRKDRLDTQLLGMERLVNMTCAGVSGQEIALHTSQRVIREEWLLQHIRLEGTDGTSGTSDDMDINEGHANSRLTASGFFNNLLHNQSAEGNMGNATGTSSSAKSADEMKHETRMRAYALRVLCNSLSNLAQANLLRAQLTSSSNEIHPLLEVPILQSLVLDLMGSNRPPSVVDSGYKLASVHESALAVRCLRLLGEQSSIVQEFLQAEPVLERLELARTCGRATHAVLQVESERTYTKLTEDVRSC